MILILKLIFEQAGPEEDEQEDIVELENLMRANFLKVSDELQLDPEVRQDSELDPEDPEEDESGTQ